MFSNIYVNVSLKITCILGNMPEVTVIWIVLKKKSFSLARCGFPASEYYLWSIFTENANTGCLKKMQAKQVLITFLIHTITKFLDLKITKTKDSYLDVFFFSGPYIKQNAQYGLSFVVEPTALVSVETTYTLWLGL